MIELTLQNSSSCAAQVGSSGRDCARVCVDVGGALRRSTFVKLSHQEDLAA